MNHPAAAPLSVTTGPIGGSRKVYVSPPAHPSLRVAVREIVTSPTLGSVVPVNDAAALVGALDHWLAPGQPRPAPVPEAGTDSAAAYLALFDRIATARIRA